ncbi:MAG: DUF1579 domain-containing protein [Planctomycetota bacterium]
MLRRNFSSLLSAAIVVLACLPLAANGDEPASADAQAEMMDKWMKFAEPGPPHEQFKRLVGKWTTVSEEYQSNPDNPPKSEGTAEFELIMGGRYLKTNYAASFSGMPMEGMGIQGYDNQQKKYVGMWIDNFGTGILTSTGTYEVASNTLTELAKGSGPMGPIKMKMVTKYESKDKFTLSIYTIKDDGSSKLDMVITHTRK